MTSGGTSGQEEKSPTSRFTKSKKATKKAKQNKQTGDKQLTKRNPTGSEAVLSDDIADRYCKRMIQQSMKEAEDDIAVKKASRAIRKAEMATDFQIRRGFPPL